MPSNFFTSTDCPDFAEPQADSHTLSRPFGSDSICFRLLMKLVNGHELTSGHSQVYGSSGDRRMREVLTWLRSKNILPISHTVTGPTGARYKAWTLTLEDRKILLEAFTSPK